MAVVFVFLRRATPTIAAGVTVPLSLVGSCAAMWVAGFSIDNLSLMALTISVGFVVDDAIVMIENIETNVERGMGRLEAALVGARQIGFTVVSISLSLIAVFVPLLFMDGVDGTAAARILLHAHLRHRHLDDRLAHRDADDLRASARAGEARRIAFRPAGRGRAGGIDPALCAQPASGRSIIPG